MNFNILFICAITSVLIITPGLAFATPVFLLDSNNEQAEGMIYDSLTDTFFVVDTESPELMYVYNSTGNAQTWGLSGSNNNPSGLAKIHEVQE